MDFQALGGKTDVTRKQKEFSKEDLHQHMKKKKMKLVMKQRVPQMFCSSICAGPIRALAASYSTAELLIGCGDGPMALF